ncbi:MAG: 50S ribosomal protein L17 [Dehalococcoidia bacterium]
MRHRLTQRKLNRPTPHRKAMLRNLVKDLLTHESIKTTEARAKEARRPAEQMITLGKDGSLHARRQALSFLNDKTIVTKVFDELAPRYTDRSGGYTRIVKLGPRGGDGAPLVQLQLLQDE